MGLDVLRTLRWTNEPLSFSLSFSFCFRSDSREGRLSEQSGNNVVLSALCTVHFSFLLGYYTVQCTKRPLGPFWAIHRLTSPQLYKRPQPSMLLRPSKERRSKSLDRTQKSCSNPGQGRRRDLTDQVSRSHFSPPSLFLAHSEQQQLN